MAKADIKKTSENVMTKADIKIIKDCRDAIDKHRLKEWKTEDEHTKATEKLMKVLLDNGFAGIAEFSKFNDQKNYEAFKECRPIKGSCDLCTGLGSDPPCLIYYKEKACIHAATPILDEKIYQISWARFKGKIPYEACPAGHGFQPDTDNYTDPPFDVKWKVF
jgi:hypothetical protein